MQPAPLTLLVPEAATPVLATSTLATSTLATSTLATSGWVAGVVARLGFDASALAGPLGLRAEIVPVPRDGATAGLAAGGVTRVEVPALDDPEETARLLSAGMHRHVWLLLLAPALASRGVTPGWWLRHAARRGLTVDALAALAAPDADEERIAWCLAAEHPPILTLRAGRAAAAALADEGTRHEAARVAAAATGVPIPLPAAPQPDLALAPDEAALLLGALRHAPFRPGMGGGAPAGALAEALSGIAAACVDPALAVGLLMDEARVPRRLAILALRETGAPAIARRLAEAAKTPPNRTSLLGLAEAAAGLARSP